MTGVIKSMGQLFYNLPLWGIFLITLVVIFVAFEIGFLLGRRRYNSLNKEKEDLVGPMVAAILSLLAFMLSIPAHNWFLMKQMRSGQRIQ
jgi:hypothetical protein